MVPDSWPRPLERELLGDKGRLLLGPNPVPKKREEGACGGGLGRERLLQGGMRCWAGAAPPGREALLGSCISGGAAEASAGKARRGGGLAVVEAGHDPV